MKKLFNTAKGFTLIELLIVIAVLGVLAAVVLTAIDPVEQLRRGRDSSRLQEVASLGHAVAAYYTAQGALLSLATNPTAYVAGAAGNWQTILVGSGDLKAPVSAPGTGSAYGTTGAYAGWSAQLNIGYEESSTSDFIIWTNAEAKSALQKAGCTAAQVAVIFYDSTKGKSGVGCVASAATAPTTATAQF